MPADDSALKEIVDPNTFEVKDNLLTFEQAFNIFKNFRTDNRERNKKNAAIARKLNNEQPYNPKKLKAANQSWRNNRPTGFMSSMIKRICPPYKQMVDQLPLLTYSHFPVPGMGADALRDSYRRNITDLIRRWEDWPDFIQQLIDENVIYGYAAVSYDDDDSWHPSVYRQDEAFFYVGCPQQANNCKVWAKTKDFFVDDVVQILKDPESAKDAGWRINGLVKKLNVGEKQFDDRGNEENLRVYEDLIRENNLSSSFTSTIRVVKTGQLLVNNPSGGIDHYIFDRNDGTPLFFRRNRYPKMQNILTLFSAEVGDQTLHGSKGAGRALYNTHVSIEQSRNLIADALHLSGLIVLKKTSKTGSGVSESPALTVVHPFAVIGDGFDVVEKVEFKVNHEAFFALDRHSTAQAEIQVGAFMPGQIIDDKGQRRTASEVNYVASIDAQIRAGVLARFADQLFSLVDEMQRRICSVPVVQTASQIFETMKQFPEKIPVYDKSLFSELEAAGVSDQFILFDLEDSLDVDSVQAVVAMLKDELSPAQILLLANSSSKANVEDAIASQSGILDVVVASYAADPLIDTVELKRRHLASKLGAETADRLMNVDLNPLSPLKQQRQQIIELSAMLGGNDVPVDPTDDDVIHLQVILDRVLPMVKDPTISPFASSQEFLARVVVHAEAHLQSATQEGADPEVIKQATDILNTLKEFVQVPPVDAAAASVVSQATAPGIQVAGISNAPVASTGQIDPMSVSQATPSTPLSQGVNDVLQGVAAPPRPTPLGG